MMPSFGRSTVETTLAGAREDLEEDCVRGGEKCRRMTLWERYLVNTQEPDGCDEFVAEAVGGVFQRSLCGAQGQAVVSYLLENVVMTAGMSGYVGPCEQVSSQDETRVFLCSFVQAGKEAAHSGLTQEMPPVAAGWHQGL